MNAFTLRQEQALVIGETIRLLVLHLNRDAVRLGIETPAGVDVVAEPGVARNSRRRDLVLWHPDPQQLLEQITARYPRSADNVRRVRTGVAYFGTDLCELARLQAYAQGVCDAGPAPAGGGTFRATSPAG